MTITLNSNHAWDVFQTVGRLLDDPTAPGVKWIASIVDNVTGRVVVRSEPADTEQAAIADAEAKYKARKGA